MIVCCVRVWVIWRVAVPSRRGGAARRRKIEGRAGVPRVAAEPGRLVALRKRGRRATLGSSLSSEAGAGFAVVPLPSGAGAEKAPEPRKAVGASKAERRGRPAVAGSEGLRASGFDAVLGAGSACDGSAVSCASAGPPSRAGSSARANAPRRPPRLSPFGRSRDTGSALSLDTAGGPWTGRRSVSGRRSMVNGATPGMVNVPLRGARSPCPAVSSRRVAPMRPQSRVKRADKESRGPGAGL